MSDKLNAAIIEASLDAGAQTRDDFLRLKRLVSGKFRAKMPPTAELRRAYFARLEKRGGKNAALEKLLVRREIRSLSGVAIVTVLTKPFPCPGRCVYCPTEAAMPKSYLSNEPAAARALANDFDPFRQVAVRLRALTENGHPADKVELIVKGGTWSAYPWDYRQWFIRRCFEACNRFAEAKSEKRRAKSEGRKAKKGRTLSAAQKINEKARHRIVGLTLETRPDWVTPEEIVRLRLLGCTRVELGVQSLNDGILAKIKRGHDAAAVVRAAGLLKDAGFKTDFHLMPQLPGATPESDLEELSEVFRNPDFRPDMIKIYPCVVVKQAELHSWWKRGDYVPYSDDKLVETLIAAKIGIPRWCRLSRLIRDIPSTSILAGNVVTNLRETVQAKMRERGLSCNCLRCREIGRAGKREPSLLSERPRLFIEEYDASGGKEYFLSFEDAGRRAVFAFCRLRLPAKKPPSGEAARLASLIPEIDGAAFIRELHTYGRLVPIAKRDAGAAQHKGLGRALMERAEKIADAAGYGRMAVISGVGVRGYYRKLGYRLRGTYMVKKLTRIS